MNARQAALTCLLNLSETDTSIAAVVDDTFSSNPINPREQRLANALVYGVVRWQYQLDWFLSHFVNPRFKLDIKHRTILRLGAFQLLHLDGIPSHAAIYETVQLTKKGSKTAGFINAVLRNLQRKSSELAYPSIESQPVKHISYALSYPEWLVKHWINEHGLAWTVSFCKSSNQIAPLTVRLNTLRTNSKKLYDLMHSYGLEAKPTQFAPEGITVENSSARLNENLSTPSGERAISRLLSEGDVYVQDESAMLVPHLLNPTDMDLIVDLCAAPGGKTSHLASLMKNTGSVIASDVSDKKLQLLIDNCKRLGVNSVEVRRTDITNDDLSFVHAADAVLIDAPCSGFGTLRRHPDIVWNKTPKQLIGLRNYQYRLLKNVAPHIKPGGILVYSTCTIERSENQEVIRRFLDRFSMFSIEHASEHLPELPKSMISSEGFLQTFPHEHGIDGTFAARLRRAP